MTLDTALKFYKICADAKIEDKKTREAILILLAQTGKVSVLETGRTMEKIIQDYTEHYGSVLYIKQNNKESTSGEDKQNVIKN